jgi:Pyruvate/2-oxoacid:ferredoxin oxidoreductase delta subunit
MPDTVYLALAEHLDEMPMGAPMCDELMEILHILYTPEEAELAVKLPFAEAPLEELSGMTGMPAEELEPMLDTMAVKGTVFKLMMEGEMKYRLLPTIVGITETPFWAGKETDMTRKLAPLWFKYAMAGPFGEMLGDRELSLVRAIPVKEEVDSTSQVFPLETVKEIVKDLDFYSVAYCPCRQIAASQGEGCEHGLEYCFHFGSIGRYIVEQGMGRELTLEETLKKMEEAHEQGMVFTSDNYQGAEVHTICSCCGCSCVFMRIRKDLGYQNTIAQSMYVPHVDEESCLGCGTCEERCPVEAIKLNDEEIAQVDEAQCLGCGVCIPTCSGEALTLVRREDAKGIPSFVEYVQAQFPQ